jgi:hypothetical protein
VTATYASEFDEGPPSLALTVTTAQITPTAINLFSPAYAAYVTATPYTGGDANGVYIPVLKVLPGFWPAALTNVSQIQYISLNFVSGYNQTNWYDSDARLVFNLTQNQGDETVIFYSYQNRVTVASDPGGIYVGSPDQAPSAGPTLVNAGAETIADQTILKRFFGVGGSAGDGTIDKTKVLQFCWFCGYPMTAINNCSVSGFTIYYL